MTDPEPTARQLIDRLLASLVRDAPAKIAILATLQQGNLSVSDIARFNGLSRPWVSTHVNSLYRDGLVTIQDNPLNKREKLVSLSFPASLLEEVPVIKRWLAQKTRTEEDEDEISRPLIDRATFSGRPITIAVIGSGYWGRKVIREILEISKATGAIKLHSIVDVSPQSLAQCQSEFGSKIDYKLDYSDLVRDPSLSGVYICTPNGTHFEVASTFLRNGKHVLVEKPLTVKSVESYELVRLAAENNRILSAAHLHRFNNGVREMQRVVSEGLIGEPYYLDVRWTGFMNPQLQREVLTDLAPHPFDVCNYILDVWPEKVTCTGRGYRTKQNEEVAFISAVHKNGLVAHIEVSWLDLDKRREVTVVGSNGTAHLDCATQRVVIQNSDGRREIAVTPSNTLASQIIHFADCIKHNQDLTPFLNHSDGILGARVVSLVEASRLSLSEDRMIRVRFPLMPEIPVTDRFAIKGSHNS